MFASKRKKIKTDNRINFIIAVVFLLGVSIIYKLYDLQITKSDYYSELALGQHKVFSELEPERGEIFFSDEPNSEDIYPAATNKEFASIYVVPKDIIRLRIKGIAEKIYIVFNEENVISKVEEILEEEYQSRLKKDLDFINSLELVEEERIKKEEEFTKKHELLLFDKEYLEWREIKKEAEIKKRKDKILDDYEKTLSKNNDPYEPLHSKVDDAKLKRFYSLLALLEGMKFSEDDLDIKNGKVVIKSKSNEVLNIKGVGHTMRIYRYYPERNVSSHILGFVTDGEKRDGKYGLEGFFNDELKGERGSVKVERGADRKVLIINDREYIAPKNGNDLVLTINRSIQFNVCSKLNVAALKHGADGGSVIVINPNTGEIIAMCSWPDYDPNNYKEVEDISVYNNPAIFASYEPGSIFKTITMAIAIDQQKVDPDTEYNDEGQIMISGWPKPIRNSDFSTHGGHGTVDMNTVLEFSLNTGAIFAMKEAGSDEFIKYIKAFGFGDKTGIELETEGVNNINNLLRKKVPEIYTATASFGQGITMTPLQMVMSYGAIANGGVLMKPYIVKEIIHENGEKEEVKPREIRRVMSERAATLVSGMLVNVVDGGHAKLAGVNGYYIGGKTGTAQVASTATRGYSEKTIHTFVGFAPIDDPAFVMLVRLDDPKDVQYSASSAAPLFGEIAEFLLQYYQIAKDR